MRGNSHRPSRLMLVVTAAVLAIALPVLACEAGSHSCASDTARASSLTARVEPRALTPLAAAPANPGRPYSIAVAAEAPSPGSIQRITGALRI